MKLIDTSIIYDDNSKTEQYTDTGDIKTAKYKAVPYNYDHATGFGERYYLVYKRCACGKFGDYLSGIRIKHRNLKSCIEEIKKYEQSNQSRTR